MPNLSLLIKPVSGACNLRCRYCFYLDESARRQTACFGTMSETTLQTLVRRAFAYADGPVSFAFQGGEPLLAGKSFYRQVLALQKQYNTRRLPVTNALQTNGTLLDDEWAELFVQGQFLVGISLDGPASLHDRYRVDAAGAATHARALQGAELLKKHGVPYNILCVVTQQIAAAPDTVFDALAPHGYLQFIPCLDALDGQPGEFSLQPEAYGRFLVRTFDRYEGAWHSGRPVSIRAFDNWVGMLLGHPPESCGMSGRCGHYYVIEADGSVYPCDFYVLDEWNLGNINDTSFFKLANSPLGTEFRRLSIPLPESCHACPYLALCRGGCRREREPFVGTAPGSNRLCAGVRLFFDQRLSRLQQLAREVADRRIN